MSQVDADYLELKLSDVVPGVIRGYSHSESSVRKASVFCLVALHAVVGEKIREHLAKLSSSQVFQSLVNKINEVWTKTILLCRLNC